MKNVVKRKFSGAYGIVLTPFQDNGTIDYDLLENQLEKAFSSSLDGLVICGSTGEFSRMSFEENTNIIRLAGEINNGRKQLVCGATASDSYWANKYMEAISKVKADGALIAPPYYFTLSDDEILSYYRDISLNNTGNVPIVGYNIPQCTAPISLKVFEGLLELENFGGFKNSWHNLHEIMMMVDLRNRVRPDVSMLTGLDSCLYATLAIGGDGLFTAITYLLPDYVRIIIDEFGKSDKSYSCQCDLLELINIINQFSFPYGYRVLAEAAGFSLGKSREVVPNNIKNLAENVLPQMKTIIDRLNGRFVK